MSNHGKIWWTELNTWNAEAAMAYYGAVLGWTYHEVTTAGTSDAEARPYYIAFSNGQPVAGIFTMISPMFDGIPEHWFTYIAVDDLTRALADCEAAGGKIHRQPFDIPEFGTLAIVADCNGAYAGMIQPLEQQASE